MALQSTIDRINDAVVSLGRAKDQLMSDGVSVLGEELVRTRRAWLEARLAHRKAYLAEHARDEAEEGDGAFAATKAADDAERIAYLAYERAVLAFDADVGCVF